ncbi:MAG: DNA topoisomerase VI subunit B [Nanoarchaeota archaeon]
MKIAQQSGDIAIELAKRQREIGVAEFFSRNRHLLGFDNKKKAILTTVKEAVDNSLDACEEADVLPELIVEIIEMGPDRYRVIIEDNGPGIVKEQIPNIFAKLLYGSKFHTFKMSRGQQGIGISASVMYGQLTTGRPARITSKIASKKTAQYVELILDTQKNAPKILKEEEVEWAKDHGTRVEIDLEATYTKGPQSVDEYLKQTAITNPHATIIYTNPKAEQIIFPRATETLPAKPQAIKPHPAGVELGVLINMLQWSDSRTLQAFLTNEFSRVGGDTAKKICENARLLPTAKPKDMSREQAEALMNGIKATKLINPPTDCVSPIGADALEKGLRKEVNAEFYASVSRLPSVYRGNPFIIEAGLAYGGQQPCDQMATVFRFANRVPLLYQQGACAVAKSIIKTNWKPYGLSQSQGAIPVGPITILVHIASVWVPFTSESKEAIAHYPEIIKEVRLALQDCGRKLSMYINKKRRIATEGKKRSYIETYIPHVAEALIDLVELQKSDDPKIRELLAEILEKHRGKLEDIEFDPEANEEYDEEMAKIGKEDEPEDGEKVHDDED